MLLCILPKSSFGRVKNLGVMDYKQNAYRYTHALTDCVVTVVLKGVQTSHVGNNISAKYPRRIL
jgi:hypothetical protein